MPVYEMELQRELARLNPRQRETLLAHVQAAVEAGEMEIIPDPGASVREDLEQPGFSELYGRPVRREAGGSAVTNVLPYSSAVGVPIPITARSPEDARDIAEGVRAASGTAALTGAAVAGGGGVAGALRGIAGGYIANQAVERGLQRAGVPEPIADTAGDIAGFAVGGRASHSKMGALLRDFMRNRLGRRAAGRIVGRAATREAPKAAATAARKITGRTLGELAKGGKRAAVTLPKKLTAEQTKIITQLQGLAKDTANRKAIKEAAKETFGADWQRVFRFIMAPHTRV